MKKITFFVAAALVVCASACSTKSNVIDNLFGVKVGTPAIEVSGIMESVGFARSGSDYDYEPQEEYFTLLGKEYHKSELENDVVISEKDEKVNIIAVSFRGHKEYDRLSKYLQKNLEQVPSITSDSLQYDDLIGGSVIYKRTKAIWVQSINGEHLVFALCKETKESRMFKGGKNETTILYFEQLNHLL